MKRSSPTKATVEMISSTYQMASINILEVAENAKAFMMSDIMSRT